MLYLEKQKGGLKPALRHALAGLNAPSALRSKRDVVVDLARAAGERRATLADRGAVEA
jgi:hypothetical protein